MESKKEEITSLVEHELLNASLKYLLEGIDQLEKRVSPILRDYGKTVNLVSSETERLPLPEYASEFTTKIRSSNIEIDTIIQRIRFILDRIDL